FDARKRLLQYDDVLRQQREIIYKERNEVIETENIREIVERMLIDVIDRSVDAYTTADDSAEWNLKGFEDFIGANLLPEGQIKKSDLEGKSVEELKA
ncbi:preprotein translocase subunit SecA, partial [Microvirga sp. 3-52]|nr:preprotein translocase subunit SecA [Microvirga sp. 3-52]